jgi:hypothetical protein
MAVACTDYFNPKRLDVARDFGRQAGAKDVKETSVWARFSPAGASMY